MPNYLVEYLIYAVGFAAQILFSARLLVQWIKSEKAGRVLSPTLFWQLSLLASFLLMVYGVLRNDLVIIAGQIISYFIYVRNLRLKKAWRYLPSWFRYTVIIFPIIAGLWLTFGGRYSLEYLWEHNEIALPLLLWGASGQVIFTFRFVYQWYFSEKEKKSVLPMGFWVISLVGSAMIISYAIYRKDPVIFFGQIFGIFIYARNIFIFIKSSVKKKSEAKHN